MLESITEIGASLFRSNTIGLGSISDFLYSGGPILTVIFITTGLLWFLIAERLMFFALQSKGYRQQMIQQWARLPEHNSWSARVIREKLISEAKIKFTSTLALIRTLTNIAPLLGLLGTVSGMIEVFDVIALSGGSNARAMAAGISKCVLSTMAGLVVGISGLYFISLLQRYSERSIRLLSQQITVGSTPVAIHTVNAQQGFQYAP